VREASLIDVVSSRIRQRRGERNLSLDKLASLAGVSKGLLVQIESGRANPSIATLCKVAAALGASVADLVQVSGQHPAEVLPAGAPRLLWRGPRGGSATLLVGSAGPDMLELWSWVLRPGERYDAPAHPHGTEELIHVVRGRLALAFGEVRYVIDSGGSAVAHTDRPHAYACEGKKPVEFTMVVAEWHAPRREPRRSRLEGSR
jgi:transcriptional regulator with XRE-family HTH domain/mannose-6-phosphate isomerase-like protein (cupin superfamily)